MSMLNPLAVNPSLNEVEVGVADPSVPEKSGAKALEVRRDAKN